MRVRRPIKFKLDAYRFYVQDNLCPVDAFIRASQENNVSLSGCMTTKSYASSYMSDDISNFLHKELVNGNWEVAVYFRRWGLS